MERGLRGVRLVISDDHPSIRGAVMAELPGARWRRLACDVLAHVLGGSSARMCGSGYSGR
ncbi:transposase [Thermus sp.]|uniref:transposase n=1 Tax=Thermus sp. TaxID=275 RepID=UPI00351AE3C3